MAIATAFVLLASGVIARALFSRGWDWFKEHDINRHRVPAPDRSNCIEVAIIDEELEVWKMQNQERILKLSTEEIEQEIKDREPLQYWVGMGEVGKKNDAVVRLLIRELALRTNTPRGPGVLLVDVYNENTSHPES